MSGGNTGSFYLDRPDNGWEVGRFTALDELEGVVHLVTTRRGPDVADLAADYRPAAEAIARLLDLRQVAWCEQVHGRRIVPVGGGGPVGRGDGMVTNVPSLGLMIRSADCPVILAVDKVSGAIGVAHASWRGTVGRIASELIVAMVGRFGVRPDDVVACICPSAGPCCYEVAPEVRDAAVGGIGRHAERFFDRREGRLYFDLWSANADELARAGVLPRNIHVSGQCTVCNNDRFPSHRVEGDGAGRFAALIGLR